MGWHVCGVEGAEVGVEGSGRDGAEGNKGREGERGWRDVEEEGDGEIVKACLLFA